MINPCILVVDDEAVIRRLLKGHLKNEGCRVMGAGDGRTASRMMEDESFDLVLLDIKLPDMSGLALLKEIQKQQPVVPVIMITAYSSLDDAVEAMRNGAYDYITKPFNLDELAITVNRALEVKTLKRQASKNLLDKKTRFELSNVIGKSPAIMEIKKLIRRIAKSEATTVLLCGESGTGKDVLAHAIHYESRRAWQPFMTITCTALPETLLESELFGHEKGAFTDARKQKDGLLELADGGAVFMDEISEMSPGLQAKLLRFLEEKTFKRVGGTKDIRVNVRVIATTNRDLEEAIRAGIFREDLYYRLNVLQIYIPPLRERKQDIPLLAKYFIQDFNREFRAKIAEIDRPCIRKMQDYHWPGNIRELRNVIERAILLASGKTLRANDITLGRAALGNIPSVMANEPVHLPAEGCRLENVEKSLLIQALKRTDWNKTRAARLLGISRDQMRYKVRKFELVTCQD